MKLQATTIAALAIEQYARLSGADKFFQSSPTVGLIQYAFTKDCDSYYMRDMLEAMESVEEVMGFKELFYEAPMNCVTRDVKFWDR